MLPHIDSLIYVDVDTFFLSPVTELWDLFNTMRKTEKMIGIAREHDSQFNGDARSQWKRYKSMPYSQPVPFNAGVLLMNLTRLRASHWDEEIRSIFKEFRHAIIKSRLADQGIINIFLNRTNDCHFELPCVWNYGDGACRSGSTCVRGQKNVAIGLFHHHSFSGRRGKYGRVIFNVFVALKFQDIAYNSENRHVNLRLSLEKGLRGLTQCRSDFDSILLSVRKYF
jgi:UDP-xylose:glucoside alpha-1,3-xylosyltransferase